MLTLLMRLAFRIRVTGDEHVPRDGPVLLTPNHVSHLDPVVLAVAAYRRGRRLRFLATAEVFDKPLVGPILRRARQIPVRRGQRKAAVEQAAAALQAGEAVVIYPEGTIRRPDRPEPDARPGAGMLAVGHEVPVVPVALWGMQRNRRRLALRRPVSVVFGPPLAASRWTHVRDPQAVSDDILNVVRQLIPVAQELAGGDTPGPRRRGRSRR